LADKQILYEKRCSNCNALLAKLSLKDGIVQIRCKCGTFNTVEAMTKKPDGVRKEGMEFKPQR